MRIRTAVPHNRSPCLYPCAELRRERCISVRLVLFQAASVFAAILSQLCTRNLVRDTVRMGSLIANVSLFALLISGFTFLSKVNRIM